MGILKVTYQRAGLVLALATVLLLILVYTATGTPRQSANVRLDGWGYALVMDPEGFPLAQGLNN